MYFSDKKNTHNYFMTLNLCPSKSSPPKKFTDPSKVHSFEDLLYTPTSSNPRKGPIADS